MHVSLLLALIPNATPATGPMELLNKFAGHRWFTSLALPDKYENIINGYRKLSDGSIAGDGRAQAIGERPIETASKYTPTKDPSVVTYTDRQGTQKLKGTVRREGDKLVLVYGSEGGKQDAVKEVLMFTNADRTVDAELYANGKMVLTYRMRRIDLPAPTPVLEGKDPVLLTQGKSESGKSSLTADFEGYRYSFVSADSKKTFEKNPEVYSVQFGGACMNMGPLSGRGQPNLYEVFENKLYLFASETCRTTFLTAPAAYIDRPEESFKVKPADLTAAVAVLDKAALAHGAIDKMTSVFRVRYTTYEQGGKTHRYDIATWSNFKDVFADAQAYDGMTIATLLSAKSSWSGTLAAPGPLVPSEQDYFRRQNLRDPLAILKNRRAPGFVAELLGPRDVATLTGQVAVRTHYRGGTTIVYLDPATHAISAIQHRGRLIQDNADVVKVYGAVKEIEGVKVPHEVTSYTADGRTSMTKFDVIKLNEPVEILPSAHPLVK